MRVTGVQVDVEAVDLTRGLRTGTWWFPFDEEDRLGTLPEPRAYGWVEVVDVRLLSQSPAALRGMAAAFVDAAHQLERLRAEHTLPAEPPS